MLGNTSHLAPDNCYATTLFPFLETRTVNSGLSPNWQPAVFMTTDNDKMYNVVVVMHRMKNEQLTQCVANIKNNEVTLSTDLANVVLFTTLFYGFDILKIKKFTQLRASERSSISIVDTFLNTVSSPSLSYSLLTETRNLKELNSNDGVGILSPTDVIIKTHMKPVFDLKQKLFSAGLNMLFRNFPVIVLL